MSKANQAFKHNDEAVSPVIGVILMVAITVVLAAVVFVLVSNLGGDSDSAPTFSLTRDDNSDRLSVAQADSSADWNRLAISSSVTTVCFKLNAATGAMCSDNTAMADGQPALDTANEEVTELPNPMGAGEFLEFCNPTTVAASVTITIVDSAANQQIGSFTFQTVGICA